jgi:hypothetical protein
MQRSLRILIATLILGGALLLSSGTAFAHHTPTPFFDTPPGCTDDWNTMQSAAGAHAPVHHTNGMPSGEPNKLSPGCTKHASST